MPNSLRDDVAKTWQSFRFSLPIIVGVLLLVELVNLALKDHYTDIFTGNLVLDPFIGAAAGSVSFGIPITSYIAGGELLSGGVSLLAVTAFIMAWTTVGLAILPLEISFLGKKFAVYRNLINLVFSMIISILTVLLLNLIR